MKLKMFTLLFSFTLVFSTNDAFSQSKKYCSKTLKKNYVTFAALSVLGMPVAGFGALTIPMAKRAKHDSERLVAARHIMENKQKHEKRAKQIIENYYNKLVKKYGTNFKLSENELVEVLYEIEVTGAETGVCKEFYDNVNISLATLIFSSEKNLQLYQDRVNDYKQKDREDLKHEISREEMNQDSIFRQRPELVNIEISE